MSFAPLLGPESPSYAFIRSSISEFLSSLAALCSSILTATFASIDNLATRIPPSWCPRCRFENLWQSYSSTGTKTTTASVSGHGTESYILKRLEDIDNESTTTALVLDTNTKICTLKKLEDIDLEKAIFRNFLPSSPQSVTVQLPGESRLLSEVLGDDTRRNRRLKHQPSLVEGIFIVPGRAGITRTTTSTEDVPRDQLPADLSATHGSFKRKQKQQQQPVELPADEISPVTPRAILPTPPPPPLLLTPRPRSPNSRKASPLLVPPPLPMIADLERKTSCATSMGSGSIQIAYTPSH